MSDEHTHFETWSAAYTLGALTPEERREFERHMASCDECTAAIASFAPLPGLMAQIDPADLEHVPDPAQADAIAARARREHHDLTVSMRRWRMTAVAGAAAAVVFAIVVAGPLSSGGGSEPDVVDVAADTAVVTTELHDWGTEVQVELVDLPTRDFYTLWTVDSDGVWLTAATWKASMDGTATVKGAVADGDAELERIVVTSGDIDDVLVSAQF